jgi:hypothetical protein
MASAVGAEDGGVGQARGADQQQRSEAMRTLEELKNVRVGDMTPDEQRMVFRAAAERLKREIESKSEQFKAVLDSEFPAG